MPGPPPKAPGTAARKDKKRSNLVVLHAEAAEQPELPPNGFPDGEGRTPWPLETVDWWEMWGRSPLASEFTENDWTELLDTAILHAQYWTNGHPKIASELRQRVAKFGATPEDRLRLRIQFASADSAEKKSGTVNPMNSARARRRGLGA